MTYSDRFLAAVEALGNDIAAEASAAVNAELVTARASLTKAQQDIARITAEAATALDAQKVKSAADLQAATTKFNADLKVLQDTILGLQARIQELEDGATFPEEPTDPTGPTNPTDPGNAGPLTVHTPELPWDMLAEPNDPAFKTEVYVHYFGPGPISIDNKAESADYYRNGFNLTNGEGGQWAKYRGRFRDRPLGRPVYPAGVDWKLEDMKTEIQRIRAFGGNGAFCNIMGNSDNGYNRYPILQKAADILYPDGSMNIIPMVDSNGSFALACNSSDPVVRANAMNVLADKVAAFAFVPGTKTIRPSAKFTDDGRFIVASFKADGKTYPFTTPAGWEELFAAIKARHGLTVAFLGGFLNISRRSDFAGKPYMIGAGDWGAGADPATSVKNSAGASIQAAGWEFMIPVSSSNNRNTQGWFDEQIGTAAMRADADDAIAQKAEKWQIVTWNDWGEGSSLAWSVQHGSFLCDILSGKVIHAKTGKAPVIKRDFIYVSHRNQLHPFKPSENPTAAVITQNTTRGSRSPVQNVVEVLTYFTAPARVTVSVGGVREEYDAPAGEFVYRAQLRPGKVSAWAYRDGKTVTSVASPIEVMANPIKDDAGYITAGPREDILAKMYDPQQKVF